MYLFALVTLIVGIMSYFLLEKPLAKWLKWEEKQLELRKKLRCGTEDK